MDTDSKKTAQKAFGVCQVCNICASKDSKVCSSGWLVGTAKSRASPDKTNLVSKSSAINSNGFCAGGIVWPQLANVRDPANVAFHYKSFEFCAFLTK